MQLRTPLLATIVLLAATSGCERDDERNATEDPTPSCEAPVNEESFACLVSLTGDLEAELVTDGDGALVLESAFDLSGTVVGRGTGAPPDSCEGGVGPSRGSAEPGQIDTIDVEDGDGELWRLYYRVPGAPELEVGQPLRAEYRWSRAPEWHSIDETGHLAVWLDDALALYFGLGPGAHEALRRAGLELDRVDSACPMEEDICAYEPYALRASDGDETITVTAGGAARVGRFTVALREWYLSYDTGGCDANGERLGFSVGLGR